MPRCQCPEYTGGPDRNSTPYFFSRGRLLGARRSEMKWMPVPWSGHRLIPLTTLHNQSAAENQLSNTKPPHSNSIPLQVPHLPKYTSRQLAPQIDRHNGPQMHEEQINCEDDTTLEKSNGLQLNSQSQRPPLAACPKHAQEPNGDRSRSSPRTRTNQN